MKYSIIYLPTTKSPLFSTYPPLWFALRTIVGSRSGKEEAEAAAQAAFLIPRGVSEIKDTERSARNGSESEREGRTIENQRRPQKKKEKDLRLDLTDSKTRAQSPLGIKTRSDQFQTPGGTKLFLRRNES